MKEEVKKLENKINEASFAMEMLQFSKEQNRQLEKHNKRLSGIIVLLIIGLFAVGGYLIYILNDIGVTETITTQEVQQENENGDNNFIGNDGDINGKAENKANQEN